ncbi:MAG: hypothetical protein LW875_03505 [Proteobacteria bacterium]|jgi:hypothetical protein|nr:hypothetical protein [Pseudomonadota bacterium]
MLKKSLLLVAVIVSAGSAWAGTSHTCNNKSSEARLKRDYPQLLAEAPAAKVAPVRAQGNPAAKK